MPDDEVRLQRQLAAALGTLEETPLQRRRAFVRKVNDLAHEWRKQWETEQEKEREASGK